MASEDETGAGARPATAAGRGWGAIVIIALLVSNVLLIWALAFYGRDEWRAMQGEVGERSETGHDDDEALQSASRAGKDDDEPVVWVPLDARRASAIVTAPLVTAGARGGASAYAIVADLQPLIESRGRHQAASADLSAAQAAVARSAADLKRLRALHADDRNVSLSVVQAAQAQAAADAARREQAQAAQRNAIEAVRQGWGAVLADALTGNGRGGLMQRLLSRESALLQVGFGAWAPGATPPPRVRLADGTVATLVGPATRTDPQFAGATFWYTAPARDLRAGSRIAVRVDGPSDTTAGKAGEPAARNAAKDTAEDTTKDVAGAAVAGKSSPGAAPVQPVDGAPAGRGGDDDAAAAEAVLVPFDAVVWHAGRAWAYVAEGSGPRGTRFERRPVDTTEEVDRGWVNTRRYRRDEPIVVQGAQLLLSEELRYQVRTDD